MIIKPKVIRLKELIGNICQFKLWDRTIIGDYDILKSLRNFDNFKISLYLKACLSNVIFNINL